MEPRGLWWSFVGLLALFVFVEVAEGIREAQGFMYLEYAKMSPFSKLQNIDAWKPRPWPQDQKRESQKAWSPEKKKEAVKVLSEMRSFIKQHIMSSTDVEELVDQVLKEAPKFPKTKKEMAMDPKGNPFERAFVRQFSEARLPPDTSRQIKGNYRGGLIRILELDWAYGARDVSQDTEELLYDNGPYPYKKRSSLSTNYLGTLEDESLCIVKEVDRSSVYLLGGATNTTSGQGHQDFCPQQQAFNIVIDIPINIREPAESVTIYMPSSVVSEYSIILPEDQSQSTYEKVCFEYPLMLYDYVTREKTSLVNMAHSCNERFCSDYWCLCGRTLFNHEHDRWNIVPAFCPLSSFFPDFLIEP